MMQYSFTANNSKDSFSRLKPCTGRHTTQLNSTSSVGLKGGSSCKRQVLTCETRSWCKLPMGIVSPLVGCTNGIMSRRTIQFVCALRWNVGVVSKDAGHKGHVHCASAVQLRFFLHLFQMWKKLQKTRQEMKDPNVMKSHYFATPLAFNAPDGGFPCDDLRKILHWDQRMDRAQKSEKILPKVLNPWLRCTNVTDDRQTDDRRMCNSKDTLLASVDGYTFACCHLDIWPFDPKT